MIQLNAEIFSDLLHLCLHLVLHSTSNTEELFDFASIEHDIATEQHKLEQQMPTKVPSLLAITQIRAFD